MDTVGHKIQRLVVGIFVFLDGSDRRLEIFVLWHVGARVLQNWEVGGVWKVGVA